MAGSLLNTHESTTTIKFLCSYGGKILPRYPDGKLRYHGGQTRVLAVNRFISFSDLLVKLGELCGRSISLRCQLPTEDLDALVSITSDEDLVNLIEEYDQQSTRQAKSLKIRAFLSLLHNQKREKLQSYSSPEFGTLSTTSTTTQDSGSPKSPPSSTASNCCIHLISSLPSVRYNRFAGKVPCYVYGNLAGFTLFTTATIGNNRLQI